jgi:hypothetical protein
MSGPAGMVGLWQWNSMQRPLRPLPANKQASMQAGEVWMPGEKAAWARWHERRSQARCQGPPTSLSRGMRRRRSSGGTVVVEARRAATLAGGSCRRRQSVSKRGVNCGGSRVRSAL